MYQIDSVRGSNCLRNIISRTLEQDTDISKYNVARASFFLVRACFLHCGEAVQNTILQKCEDNGYSSSSWHCHADVALGKIYLKK